MCDLGFSFFFLRSTYRPIYIMLQHYLELRFWEEKHCSNGFQMLWSILMKQPWIPGMISDISAIFLFLTSYHMIMKHRVFHSSLWKDSFILMQLLYAPHKVSSTLHKNSLHIMAKKPLTGSENRQTPKCCIIIHFTCHNFLHYFLAFLSPECFSVEGGYLQDFLMGC